MFQEIGITIVDPNRYCEWALSESDFEGQHQGPVLERLAWFIKKPKQFNQKRHRSIDSDSQCKQALRQAECRVPTFLD